MSDPRRYSDKEVSVILKRATELQRAEPSAPNPEGLTLRELEEIAREAGIAVDLLRRAASELDTVRPAGFWARLAGAPAKLRLERTVQGELSDQSLEELVPYIQLASDAPGQASTVGRTLTWSSVGQGNSRTLQVLIAVREGETLIRIEERLGGVAGGLFGGIVGGGGGSLGGVGGPAVAALTGSAVLTTGFVLASLGACYYLARVIFVAQVRSRERKLEALMQRIVEKVEASFPDNLLDSGGT